MANVLNYVRAKVSQGRSRFKDDEFDLDLSYIRPNVIAMGFPSTGMEAAYRNPITEVAAMLEKYHSDHYMVWNVSEREYDYSKFKNNVLEFGWPDHHAPPLELLFQICNSMKKWLILDDQNVVVVHCVAGKGRTGVVNSCFLLYSGQFEQASDALDYVAKQRGGGVTYMSQRRYVDYFGRILRGFEPVNRVYTLEQIVMKDIPELYDREMEPIVEIYFQNKHLLYRSGSAVSPPPLPSDPHPKGVRPANRTRRKVFRVGKLKLYGDILVVFKNRVGVRDKYFFRFSFHTGFVGDKINMHFSKDMLCNGNKDSRIPPDFFVDVFLTPVEESKDDDDNDDDDDVAPHKQSLEEMLMNPKPRPWPWVNVLREYRTKHKVLAQPSSEVTMSGAVDIKEDYIAVEQRPTRAPLGRSRSKSESDSTTQPAPTEPPVSTAPVDDLATAMQRTLSAGNTPQVVSAAQAAAAAVPATSSSMADQHPYPAAVAAGGDEDPYAAYNVQYESGDDEVSDAHDPVVGNVVKGSSADVPAAAGPFAAFGVGGAAGGSASSGAAPVGRAVQLGSAGQEDAWRQDESGADIDAPG